MGLILIFGVVCIVTLFGTVSKSFLCEILYEFVGIFRDGVVLISRQDELGGDSVG